MLISLIVKVIKENPIFIDYENIFIVIALSMWLSYLIKQE